MVTRLWLCAASTDPAHVSGESLSGILSSQGKHNFDQFIPGREPYRRRRLRSTPPGESGLASEHVYVLKFLFFCCVRFPVHCLLSGRVLNHGCVYHHVTETHRHQHKSQHRNMIDLWMFLVMELFEQHHRNGCGEWGTS